MNRYDDRRPRFWRHGRGRDDSRRDEEYRFEAGEESGRTAGDPDQQQFSGNPYGYYPGGQGGPRRGGSEWGGRWGRGPDSGPGERGPQPYGQREPYNARSDAAGARSGAGPSNEQGSRYSESQYGQYGGGMRPGRMDSSGDRYEPEFGGGPFADTGESPGYFGTGYYGDGGASYTGGFDQRYRTRYPGSLGEDTFHSGAEQRERERRRYRTGPKGYTRSDDRIREDICERLMLADGIDSSEMSVSVKDGKVTLDGTVPTRSMKHAIEDLADYTAGVQDVDNRIRVERPGAGTGTSSTGVQSASGVTPTSGGSRTTKQ